MRTSIEFPDSVYRQLKLRAAQEGTTIREIVLEGVAIRLRGSEETPRGKRGPRFPVIRAKNPGSLRLGEEGVYEYIPFP
jgi:hypothetical protein